MAHSILITGGSGYLGGTFLARLDRSTLPPHKAIHALVRTPEQDEAVRQYGVEPIHIDLNDNVAVESALLQKQITVVFFLIDAFKSDRQVTLIKALAQVKAQTGNDVHFLHTTGAKIFSGHAGMPTDRAFTDGDDDLYALQKAAKAPIIPPMDIARNTNNVVIETAEQYGVRSYIFIPCIVYGAGEGFGNRISIQTVAIVQAAEGTRRVYDVNAEGAIWPVCHVVDNATLYRQILCDILSGSSIGFDKQGYYLASPGSVLWKDLYIAMASALAKRGIIEDSEVRTANEAALEQMGRALGCAKEVVALQLGGQCSLQATHGNSIGWVAQYPAKHILDAADDEVELILANLKESKA